MTRPAVAAENRFMNMVMPEPNSGCWLWMGFRVGNTYGRFRVSPDERADGAHRASWRLFVGEIPDGHVVCHSCDTPACVNPEHLFTGTYADNMRDAARKGRMIWKDGQVRALPIGEKHHAAKLCPDDVRCIRESDASGPEVAKKFGVSVKTISRVRRRESWEHVQ